MNFEEFTLRIKEDLPGYLSGDLAGAKVGVEQFTKNNDQVFTGITVQMNDSGASLVVYLEGYYLKYISGVSLADILSDMAEACGSRNIPSIDIKDVTDLDNVADNILCKVINAERNKEYLKDKPHKIIEDLAVIYYIDLGETDDHNARLTVTITNSLFAQYYLNINELHRIALFNMWKSGIEFRSMHDMLIDLARAKGVSLPDELEDDVSGVPQMFVLSANNRFNGAAAILREQTMEEISDSFGGHDFVVIPSSVHEVIILPIDESNEGYDKDMLNSMVCDVNENEVAETEYLSDHVYIYKADEKKLVSAA